MSTPTPQPSDQERGGVLDGPPAAALPPPPPARERILAVAEALFYRHGIRAIGVDRIIADAEVAKATFYRLFRAKDDLVVAFLERRNERYWVWFDAAVLRHPGDAAAQLQAVIDTYARRLQDSLGRGCPFVNTATEFPESDHPGHHLAAEQKRAVLARLTELARAMDARHPELLAEQLLLLMDGASISIQMLGRDGPAAHLGEAARTLIAAQRRFTDRETVPGMR